MAAFWSTPRTPLGVNELPLAPWSRLYVLTNVFFAGGLSLVTDGDLVPLDEYLHAQGPCQAKQEDQEHSGSARAAPKTKYSQELLQKSPWLAQEEKDFNASSSAALETTEEEQEDSLWAQAVKGHVSEEMAQIILDLLESKRKGWEAEGVGRQGICRMSVCKGTSTFEKTGYPYDAVFACASGQAASDWCSAFLGKGDRRWDFSLYGDPGCFILARAWCHKVSYFHSLWQNSLDPAYVFSQADVQNWPEPQEFANFALGATAAQWPACQEIRDMRPIT